MVGFSEKAHQLGFRKFSDIPEHLVYEEWDGVPILYQGVRQYALQHQNLKTLQMGSSIFQSLIIEFILRTLFRSQLDTHQYAIVTNEAGLQLGYRDTLSNDIAIVERALITNKFSTKYSTIAPKVTIEVDVKADYTYDFDSFDDYIAQKTIKLLDFGVEKVIWILSSDTKSISVYTQSGSDLYSWEEEVEILEGVTFCMNNMDLG